MRGGRSSQPVIIQKAQWRERRMTLLYNYWLTGSFPYHMQCYASSLITRSLAPLNLLCLFSNYWLTRSSTSDYTMSPLQLLAHWV